MTRRCSSRSLAALGLWASGAGGCTGGTPATGADSALLATMSVVELPTVVLNEVLIDNEGGFEDETGGTPDWVELWNESDEPIDLEGWWLSDETAEPFKWRFEDLRIKARDYLIVFCDNDDEGDEGATHVSFDLDPGDDLQLYGPNPDNALVDNLRDLASPINVSLARVPDGGEWTQTTELTPGAPNK